ncbi:hypothetical protein [Brasilonema sp. UFV-L1]|uniref:hypothetical protein n=1 Tax=Brasilonema sp. UFV-L1 TaxID=2234130 RepID=UPI00145C545B|nr:hypothetical protein [Brasilonema sp. UFV-L1]NMG10969.1 hypothetical protein [Brasilonema sp. UFV-L1]
MATDDTNSSNQFTSGTSNSGNILGQSPWGRLNEVTSTETVLEGFESATGGGTTNDGITGGGSGNPFTNFGNPNASGSPLTGGTNPWSAISTGNSSAPSSSDTSTASDNSSAGISGFELRVSIDNQVNQELTEALGDNLPTNQAFSSGNNPFDPGFGSNVSNQAIETSSSGGSDSSNSVIPSATDLAGVDNYSADSVTVSASQTSGGSSLSVNTYSPSTSAPSNTSLTPISGGASSSNPFAAASSNSFSGSQNAGGFGSTGLGTGTTNTFAGAANNPYAGGGGQPFASLGNVIVGEKQWIIGKEITPERFSKAINFTVDEMVDSVIGKLSNRVSESGIKTSSTGGNPFAGGNNPFGNTNAPALDYLKQAYGADFPVPTSASNFLTSVYSQTLPSGSSNSFAGASTSGAIGGNTSTDGRTAVQQSSLDIVKVLFGDNLPTSASSSGRTSSSSETLRIVQDDLLNFTKTVNSATGKKLFSTNSTPLKSPSDLLTLYKNDILSVNTPVNTVNEQAGGGDPFTNLFGGSNSQAVNPPTDVLYTVLGGLLPFSGSDNIFNTPEGGIPIGYGNKDFGSNNAVIGNSNWDYGQFNASIGNANWHWDSSKYNATIGNGNWHLDSSRNNRTIGNGNWYWESTSDNTALGNGNWHFGNNNTTIGNGNWDFGSNNTIIGNGNYVFTSNSIVIGDGNWSVIIDKSATGAGDFLGKLDNLVLSIGVKDAGDNLINSLAGKFADAFQPLTGGLGESALKTYNQLFYSNSESFLSSSL